MNQHSVDDRAVIGDTKQIGKQRGKRRDKREDKDTLRYAVRYQTTNLLS